MVMMMVESFAFAVAVGSLLFLLSSLVLVFGRFAPLLLHHRAVPRGSFGWPLLGETLSFFSPHASNTIGSFLEEHCSRYGKVFKSHLFFTPAIVSCDQELNQFILQNEEKLFQCSYPKPIHGILGKSSMIVVVGENHKRLRNLALTLVSSTKSRAGYLNDVERIALDIQNSWHRGKVFFYDEARKYTFSVIVKQVLGLEPDELKTSRILEDFLTFMKGLISFPLYVPGTSYTKAVKARGRISLTVKGIIEERRKSGGDSSNKGDFLDVLLSMNNLTEEERISFVLDSLLGGYETTSLLLSMVVYFLGQSPMALAQLKSEHQTIRESKKNCEYLTSEDYKKMEFTQWVINEALRCGNIVKFVHRKAIKDVRYKEYLIPCGWKVLPVLSAVHLDSTLHGNAQEFNPWRWENQTSCKTFTPFGGGPRLCPGSELAKVEVAFFMHHFLLKFRWRPEGEDIPMAYPYVEFPRGLPIEIEPSVSTFHD